MNRFFEHNLTLKLFSIAIAIVLWSMNPYNQDPYRDKVFRDIPVNVINQEKLAEKGLMLSSDIPGSFSIEVRGKTSDLQRLNKSDINRYVDLSKINGPGINEVPVDIRGIPLSIQINEEYKFELNVDRIISKTIPVTLDVDEENQDKLARRYWEISPKFIEVKGAESAVNKIVYGRAYLSMSEEKDEELIEQSIPVQLMDINDNPVEVKYVDQNPQFCIATVYPSRAIPVDPLITGNPAEGYVVVGTEISPGEIQVSGLPEIIKSLGTLRTELLDIEGASTDIKRELKLQNYEGVYISPGEQSQVQVLVRIEKIVEKTIEFGNIELQNIPPEHEAKLEDTTVSVVIRGPSSYISAVKPTDIQVYVNLEDAVKGEKSYPVEVRNIPKGVELINVEPVRVRISIK